MISSINFQKKSQLSSVNQSWRRDSIGELNLGCLYIRVSRMRPRWSSIGRKRSSIKSLRNSRVKLQESSRLICLLLSCQRSSTLQWQTTTLALWETQSHAEMTSVTSCLKKKRSQDWCSRKMIKLLFIMTSKAGLCRLKTLV